MIILRLVTSLFGGLRVLFWKPFKNIFLTTIVGTSCYEYGKILTMQEIYPANDVVVRITKFQSLLLWISDLKPFHYFSVFVNNMSVYTGWAKSIVALIVIAVLTYIIVSLFLKIKELVLPKRKELTQQGIAILKELADADVKRFTVSESQRIDVLNDKLKQYEDKLKDLSDKNKILKKQLDTNKELYNVNNYIEKINDRKSK